MSSKRQASFCDFYKHIFLYVQQVSFLFRWVNNFVTWPGRVANALFFICSLLGILDNDCSSLYFYTLHRHNLQWCPTVQFYPYIATVHSDLPCLYLPWAIQLLCSCFDPVWTWLMPESLSLVAITRIKVQRETIKQHFCHIWAKSVEDNEASSEVNKSLDGCAYPRMKNDLFWSLK